MKLLHLDSSITGENSVSRSVSATITRQLERAHPGLETTYRDLVAQPLDHLTLTLKNLERDGLVRRTVTPTVPPRVDYELTPLGRSMLEPVRALGQWAQAHIPQMDAARADYDRRNA